MWWGVCKMPIQSHLNKYWAAPCLFRLFFPVKKEEINYFTLRLIMCSCQNVFRAKHGNYVLCSSLLSPGMLRGKKTEVQWGVFAISVILPHLSYVISNCDCVILYYSISRVRDQVITVKSMSMCVLLCVSVYACLRLSMCIFICTALYMCCFLPMCVCMCVIVHIIWFSVYLCASSERRQGIMICTFIPLCTAPFTYPHGEDACIELACQCECLAALHAASVLLVSKGIIHGERALWLHWYS